MEETQSRGGFGSNFGFIMAAVGSAVGLGNIWGFPYKMGKNGGFAFLLVYLVLAIFVGLCVMLGEMALGRKTGQGVVGAYKKMASKYAWVGWCGIITGFCILCFYLVLGGMVTRYTLGYLISMFGGDGFAGQAAADFFGYFLCNGVSMVIYFFVFALLNVLIVSGGIQGGIEKFNKIAMPALFFILLIVLIYVACQPGAGDGYKFMFAANFDPLKSDFIGVLKTAAGQMFFSLSLGMGCMITYGSYLGKHENLQKNSVIVVICDTAIAILAGCVVLPACAAFGLDFGGGPGLLFSTMQVVFDKMGGSGSFIGDFMGFLFYFLVFLAAMSSSVSILEVCTAYSVDKNMAAGKGGKDGGRKKATALFAVAIFIVGLPVALDALGTGVAGGAPISYPAELLGMDYKQADTASGFDADTTYYVAGEEAHSYTAVTGDVENAITAPEEGTTYYVKTVKGWNDCWLDFFDMISEGILMPLGALMMSILIGWKWKTDLVMEECMESGHKPWGRGFFDICFKFITPIGMLFVLYGQITSFFG